MLDRRRGVGAKKLRGKGDLLQCHEAAEGRLAKAVNDRETRAEISQIKNRPVCANCIAA